MRYLITGGCGFLGSNLADAVLEKGEELFLLDNFARVGTRENLAWLKTKGEFKLYEKDARHFEELSSVVHEVKPDVIFHLAGQVAMTTSISDPRLDFETNVVGGNNLLESVRKHAPSATVIYSSTNKVYGDMEEFHYSETETRYVADAFPKGFDESVRLDFRSPYGCSKGATDQYMLDYARIFGLNTVVFRHSSICGGRQFSTYDQGWVGWFVRKALEEKKGMAKEPFTISGTGKQVRDVLFAQDLVKCYFAAAESIQRSRGQAFNIGGGMENSLSLLELFDLLGENLDVKLKFRKLPPRESDQKVFVADTGKAQRLFGWSPTIGLNAGMKRMINWVSESAF